MTICEKLSALREIMERKNLDAYIVSGTDPHNSEYLPAAWKQREWISGFTGSFGTVVVLKDSAGLWTDTRYFIQAGEQLDGTGIELHKLRIPGAVNYPEWLAEHLPAESRVGLDSHCITVNEMRELNAKLNKKNIKVVEECDLIGDIWLDRPALPDGRLTLVSSEITGVSAREKIRSIRELLRGEKSDYLLLSALDEIAWLYNIRCNDIEYNPVAISYAVVGLEKAYLFVNRSKVSPETKTALEHEGIEIDDYHHLSMFIETLEKDSRFCLDPETLNYAVYHRISDFFPVEETTSPVILSKSVKTDREIEGFRLACLKDGIAMTKFFYWLEKNVRNSITESEASKKLSSIRALDDDYVSDSFENISAYGKNAALPHYSAVPGHDSLLEAHGLYLVDSGGQYTHGTTDITRTIALGGLTAQEKEDYTLVLKGMIALSQSVFPMGTRGCNLDAIARQPLWQNLRNFGHGTGHGIGFFLNVHEGPQSIRQELNDQPLLPGMVTSDEPGLYREGKYGIRHENVILCKQLTKNEFGEWYNFETLTLCYFDTSALSTELLTQDEKTWLNEYHKRVYDKISPFLNGEEKEWLKIKTSPIA